MARRRVHGAAGRGRRWRIGLASTQSSNQNLVKSKGEERLYGRWRPAQQSLGAAGARLVPALSGMARGGLVGATRRWGRWAPQRNRKQIMPGGTQEECALKEAFIVASTPA